MGSWKAVEAVPASSQRPLWIIPVGELEGRRGDAVVGLELAEIIPVGELEGRRGWRKHRKKADEIIPVGELEGRRG